jgi:hypothetical protein
MFGSPNTVMRMDPREGLVNNPTPCRVGLTPKTRGSKPPKKGVEGLRFMAERPEGVTITEVPGASHSVMAWRPDQMTSVIL